MKMSLLCRKEFDKAWPGSSLVVATSARNGLWAQLACNIVPFLMRACVTGPLIGADLLHLREIEQSAAGVASIGGAGTFDGIVLSGIVAAYLA